MWSRRNFFSVLGSLGFLGVSSSGEPQEPQWKIGDWRLMPCDPPCDYGRITTRHHHWMKLKRIIPWPYLDEDTTMEVWEEPPVGNSKHAVHIPRWKRTSPLS